MQYVTNPFTLPSVYCTQEVPFLLYSLCGPGSSVGIATDYGLDGPGSNPGGDEIFRPSRLVLGPTQPPVKWVPGLSRGVKCGRGVLLTTHHLLVPRSWNSRAIPLPTLRATPGLQRKHFTFTFTLCNTYFFTRSVQPTFSTLLQRHILKLICIKILGKILFCVLISCTFLLYCGNKGCPKKSARFKVRAIVLLLGWQSRGGHLSDIVFHS